MALTVRDPIIKNLQSRTYEQFTKEAAELGKLASDTSGKIVWCYNSPSFARINSFLAFFFNPIVCVARKYLGHVVDSDPSSKCAILWTTVLVINCKMDPVDEKIYELAHCALMQLSARCRTLPEDRDFQHGKENETFASVNFQKAANNLKNFIDNPKDKDSGPFDRLTYKEIVSFAQIIADSANYPKSKLGWTPEKKPYFNTDFYLWIIPLQGMSRLFQGWFGNITNGQEASLYAVKWANAVKKKIENKSIAMSINDYPLFQDAIYALSQQAKLYTFTIRYESMDTQASENYKMASDLIKEAIAVSKKEDEGFLSMVFEEELSRKEDASMQTKAIFHSLQSEPDEKQHQKRPDEKTSLLSASHFPQKQKKDPPDASSTCCLSESEPINQDSFFSILTPEASKQKLHT